MDEIFEAVRGVLAALDQKEPSADGPSWVDPTTDAIRAAVEPLIEANINAAVEAAEAAFDEDQLAELAAACRAASADGAFSDDVDTQEVDEAEVVGDRD